jgi:hypothetical protein
MNKILIQIEEISDRDWAIAFHILYLHHKAKKVKLNPNLNSHHWQFFRQDENRVGSAYPTGNLNIQVIHSALTDLTDEMITDS